jgi:hypothetical protein
VEFLCQLLSACLGYETGQASLVMDDFQSILDLLANTGLIFVHPPPPTDGTRKRKKKRNCVPSYQPLKGTQFLSATITIAHPLEDIESAIEKVVVAQPYYGRLLSRFDCIVNRMKTISIHSSPHHTE